jgi:hypothetical protein
MRTIQMIPAVSTAHFELAADCQSKNWEVYCPATNARLGMTRTSAAMMAQPEVHPLLGPIALLTHVNVVPQSGSARFR